MILLFGKRPQRCFPSMVFKIGRFGKDEADLMFQDVIEGNITNSSNLFTYCLRRTKLEQKLY